MDAKEAFLKISQNEENFGRCDMDTAANLINNEETLNRPITSYMMDPVESNPNGSIRINNERQRLESGFFDGAAQTLANARLYAFYKPVEQELFEKEQSYKKAVFDSEGFFTQFANDYMYNKYSQDISAATYRMAKAQQAGALNTVVDEQYKIKDLQNKLSQYIQPNEGVANSTANVISSMARTFPETLSVSVGAGIVTALTGGMAAPILVAAGSGVLNASIVYKDTYDLEAGEMYMSLEGAGLSEDERLRVSEDAATLNAGLEASGAIFGTMGIALRGTTKIATSLTKGGRKWFAKKQLKELGKSAVQRKTLEEFAKKGIGEKLKDPKYLAYIGKRTAEHVFSAGAEGLQEVSQELIKDAYIDAVRDAENPENELTIKNIFNVLGDGSKTSQYASLFLNTALASLLISGTGATATTGVKTGYQKLLARSMEKMNIDQVGDNIIKQKENSQAYKKSPKAYSENTRAIIDAGNAPEKAAVNTGTLLDILDDAEKNGKTNILQKFTQMGVSRESLEKDVTLTGQTNIDFQKFDEIVLDPKDPELYQKIRGNWTTDDTTLTGKEMQVLVNDMLAKRPELSQAVNDPNSFFNKILYGLQKNPKYTPKRAVYDAMLAQMKINRIMTLEGGSEKDARKIELDLINTKQSLLDKAKNIFDEVKTKVVEARDTKQVESIAGEYANMLGQPVSDFHKRFATAIVQKDFKSLSELLLAGSGMNENSKKMFEKETGKKLPKTIKEREQFLVEWAGHDYEKYLEEKKAAQKTEAIERERREKKERLKGYIKELEESLVNDSGKIISKKEFIDSLVEEGRHLETKKVGINNVYRLVDDNGYYAEFKKKSEKEYIDSLFEATDEDLSGLFGEKKLYSKTQEAEYTKETINIDGVERPTKNSEDNPIARTETELRAFYNWFGDSKVVDEQGRPLVVYHGSENGDFDVFDYERIKYSASGPGFNFSKEDSGIYGKSRPFYLRITKTASLDRVTITRDQLESTIKQVNKKGNDNLFILEGYGNPYKDYEKALKSTVDTIMQYAENDAEILDNIRSNAKGNVKNVFNSFVENTGKDGFINDERGIYVSFDDKSMKLIDNTSFSLESNNVYYSKTQDQQIAGVFSEEMGRYIIKLTEAANPTTFMHEFNHLIVTEMLKSYNGGKMTEYWKKQILKMADFVGAEPVNGKLSFTTEQMELLAEAFTTYLKEGRPPIESLRDVFNYMSSVFIDVYRKLVMAKVPLNKSIRSAFDALLVSQEEIDQAIIDKNLRAIGRRDWVTDEDYQGYISDLSSLSRVSTNKHIEAIRKKMRIAIQEKNKAKMEEIQKDIDAKVNSRPEYLFENAVLNTKINLASIPEGYKIKNKKYVSEKEGLPVAEFINTFPDLVSNVADVVGLLNNLEDKQTVIENETREAFNEWLDKEYEGKKEFIEADAKLATANEKLIDVRVKEYLMLNKIPLSQFNQYRQELIRAVNREVKNMQLRELTNLERWQNLEVKIVTKARFAKSDSELANSLWHQAAVNQIIIRAKEIKSQVYKFNKHFNKYRYLPTKDALKTIDAYDFDLVTAVLRNIGFTKKHPRIRDISVANRLENWIEEKTAKSFSTAESVRSYIPTLNRETDVKFDKNTYGDFAVFDVLSRLIEGISMSDKVKTEEAGRQLRQEDANSVAEFIEKKKITKISSAFTDFTMVAEQLLKKILPEKVFNEYVLPYMQAHTLREQRISKMDKLLYNAIENTLKNRERSIAITLPSGEVFNMTYEQLQVAVLNIDNMETWLATFNKENKAELDEDAFLSIIEQAPEQMLVDARTIWDIFDSQKAEFRDAQYKVDGFLMDYVEPRSITLSDGRTIQSGYFPRGKKPVGKNGFTETIKPTNIDGVYTFGTSRYAKDRLSASHNELDLTINSIRSWMYHTATVIEIGPAFNKLQKLFDNEIIKNAFGEKAIDYFNRWMEYSVVGDSVNKFFSSVDKLASVQILGYTPIKLITQAIGFVPALNETGMLWGLPQLFNPKNIMNLFNVSFAKQLSPYMRERYDNAINHLASISKPNQIFASAERTTDKIMNYLMYFIIHGDAFASSIVWNGAYNKAIAQGKNSEQATLIADSAVRRTQGDSSIASRAEAMRGNKRFMTKFASYFISVNSRFTSALIGKDYVEAVSVAMLAGVLAPVLESMIRTAVDWEIGDDDDKKKWRKLKIHSFEDLMYYNIKSNVATTIGSSAIPTLGIGAFSANVLATGQAFKNPLPMIEYLNNLAMAGLYPIRAAVVETETERRKLLKQAKKSALKVLTVPNKLSKMIVE